ncbi:hypothetical protein YH65_08840 [Sulfurovum lithotrophicum]|uniref:Nucleotidyltransferase-like domain-containing protein n=1 Tax=Sulfurovum lithotrophicum TaxID=206403 RepID=A0A7U4RR17_9BACT|nr:GSU2403 family nucleotidyltransferase fold protein [Sulfurovum lithotrophicum]AKF25468.1 hypothetical protein YH65_08840 [Sulfurovum lithotrophicum]
MSFHFTEYTASQRKHYINTQQLYEYYIQKRQRYLREYHISMYWKKVGGKEYLTKKRSSTNKVVSLGAKNAETIKIYEEFKRSKAMLKEEIAQLESKLERARKLSKIEQLTRVPNALVNIYRKINELGLDEKMILIGTNALYAYESYCGVFIEEENLATDDIDLLNKHSKALSVVFDEVLPQGKLTEMIKLIDKSFEPDGDVPYRFRNKEGVLLEVLSPVQEKDAFGGEALADGFTNVLSLTMEGMQWLENSRIFKSMVIADNGKCAILSTIHPLEFAVYKYWLSTVSDRNILKKNRDEAQARLVTQLIKEYMVNINILQELESMKHFKKELVEIYMKEMV